MDMEPALLAYLSLGLVLHLFARPKRHALGGAIGDPRSGGDTDGNVDAGRAKASLLGFILAVLTLPYNAVGRAGALATSLLGAGVLLGALYHFFPGAWAALVGWLDAVGTR